MRTVNKGMVLALLIPFLWVGATIYADGHSTKNEILYRKNVMKAIGGHMTAMSRILKGEVHHSGHLAGHAQAMALSAKMVGDIFPEGTHEGKTAAKANIWEEKDKFANAVKMFEEEAQKMATVAAGGDMAAIGAQMKNLGKSCGNCHKPFRKKRK